MGYLEHFTANVQKSQPHLTHPK